MRNDGLTQITKKHTQFNEANNSEDSVPEGFTHCEVFNTHQKQYKRKYFHVCLDLPEKQAAFHKGVTERFNILACTANKRSNLHTWFNQVYSSLNMTFTNLKVFSRKNNSRFTI